MTDKRPERPFALADRLYDIALGEMLSHVDRQSLKPLAKLAFSPAARSLADNLAAFDRDLAEMSLRRASLRLLGRYGARPRLVDAEGGPHFVEARRAALPEKGPLLVVSNHPGLFDALALFSALGREDLAVIAAVRDLLGALPHVGPHLVAAPPDARAGIALRRAAGHLAKGGLLLHFPAGRIEPDPRLLPEGQTPLHPFLPGLDPLIALAAKARPELVVATVIVSGVVSPRARSVADLIAGRTGLTDAFVPLLQLTLPFFGDVDVRLTFGPERRGFSLGDKPSAILRADLEALAASIPRHVRSGFLGA